MWDESRLLTASHPHIREKAQPVLSSVLISREPGRDLHPRVEAELVEDVVDVVVDGALREVEPRRDLAVAQARGQQAGDLLLAAAEDGRHRGWRRGRRGASV